MTWREHSHEIVEKLEGRDDSSSNAIVGLIFFIAQYESDGVGAFVESPELSHSLEDIRRAAKLINSDSLGLIVDKIEQTIERLPGAGPVFDRISEYQDATGQDPFSDAEAELGDSLVSIENSLEKHLKGLGVLQ